MRTLVVSDLPLGTRLGRDVLRHDAPRAALLAALDGVDRLVLLGDTVELLEGRPAPALAIAEPVLRALGLALGREREVVVVPGNHDRELIHRWLNAHAAEVGLDTVVPSQASAELAAVVEWLAPARVSVRYPGLWLADGVWATHGHYLDRHLLPISAYGVARGRLGRRPRDLHRAEDYEAGPHLTGLEGFLTGHLPRLLSELLDDFAAAMRAAAMGRAPLMRRFFAPFASGALAVQVRRAAIPALAQVVANLGVDAHTVIFGHVHRLGPRDGDDHREWAGDGGAPRILNTGCWVHEPLLLAGALPPHPYWPGGAVVIDDGGPPRAVSLLD